jgi:hypothetical protein
MISWIRGGLELPWLALLALLAAGCGQADNKPAQADAKKSPQAQQVDGGAAGKGKAAEATKHTSWWCDEHGIPEAECSMCSKKVAEACKAKGDWCDKHNRARSQCFLCEPQLREKYAARYRARYGKEPPPTEDEEKNDEKSKKG